MSFWKYLQLFFFLVVMQMPLTANAQQLFFVTKPNNRLAIGEKFNYTFSAGQAANQSINYTCTNLPDWITFDRQSNTLSGVAKTAGQYSVGINATRNDSIVRQNFMLTVYNKQTLNILPLGNSITNGTGQFNSYRRNLWQLLHTNNYNFDFVGSWDWHHDGTPVPNPDFDMDHEGHSGWTANNILTPPDWDNRRGNIDSWLELYTPDIVLMELGTNEIFQCASINAAINNLSIIIDKIRNKKRNVKILLAQIPPLGKQWTVNRNCHTDTTNQKMVELFNSALIQFSKTKSNRKSKVIIVDQFSGIDPETEMYDGIHPNEKGEFKMANRWFIAVKPFLKMLE